MRQVIYQVAASLDGFIAGPNGEVDWIVHDPAASVPALYATVDTVLLGRRTYELTQQPGAPKWPKGWRLYVFSRTLRAAANRMTIVRENAGELVHALRAESGGDIWLFGGASLFASLLTEHAVDRVDVTVMPVLLGGGVPLVAPGGPRTRLRLTESRAYGSGIVSLRYAVEHADR